MNNYVSRLGKEALKMRQSLFDEGIVNEQFVNVELIERVEPNFVVFIIRMFLNQSRDCLDQLQHALETKPDNYHEAVSYFIMKLKGSSAMVGVAKFNETITDMWDVFEANSPDNRLHDAYEQVRAGYDTLKTQLEPYVELLDEENGDFPDQVSEVVDMDDELETTATSKAAP